MPLLTKAQLDSVREEPGVMSRRDIGTGRDTLVLPLGPLTGPQRGVLCFQLEYRWLQHPVTPPCSAFPCLLKSVLKPLHWEPCFPLSTLIWLHRPPTRFASSANGRGEELNSPLSSCSRSLTNAPLAHTHTHVLLGYPLAQTAIRKTLI